MISVKYVFATSESSLSVCFLSISVLVYFLPNGVSVFMCFDRSSLRIAVCLLYHVAFTKTSPVYSVPLSCIL